MFADTPAPPYYAVIFTSLRNEGDGGYGEMGQRMFELATQQLGFLGIESARAADGIGITLSYWTSLEAIAAWKRNAEHQLAQSRGRAEWYRGYKVRIARVDRDYAFGL